MIGLIIATIMIVTMGISGFVIFKIIKMSDPQSDNVAKSVSADNTKDFLPFVDIDDNIIDLGGYQYRAIIECSSVNFGLKSEVEQEMTEISFQRLLNSLTYPITLYIETRLIDNSEIVKNLERDIEKNIKKFPKMINYANAYIEHMENLSYEIGNDRQKKKYIIIPYGDAVNMTELTDEEKKDFSRTELMTRVLAIKDHVEGIGLKAKVLDRNGIARVLYSCMHRRNYQFAKDVFNGEYSSLLVSGVNVERMASKELILKSILEECNNKIKNSLAVENISNDELKLYQEISNILENSSTLISESETIEEMSKIDFEKDVAGVSELNKTVTEVKDYIKKNKKADNSKIIEEVHFEEKKDEELEELLDEYSEYLDDGSILEDSNGNNSNSDKVESSTLADNTADSDDLM